MRTLNQSIMTAKSHPAAIRFVPDQLPRDHISDNHMSNSDPLLKEPARRLILRVNGELSLLDLDDRRERELTDSVELFWVTFGQSEEKSTLVEENFMVRLWPRRNAGLVSISGC